MPDGTSSKNELNRSTLPKRVMAELMKATEVADQPKLLLRMLAETTACLYQRINPDDLADIMTALAAAAEDGTLTGEPASIYAAIIAGANAAAPLRRRLRDQ